MGKDQKIELLFLALAGCMGIVSGSMSAFGAKTFIGTRSPAVNAINDLIGWQKEIHRDESACYAAFSLLPAYYHSVSEEPFDCYLFGGKKSVFSGSQIPDRGADDILADYFGLAPDFYSTVCFEPKIATYLFEVQGFIGLDPLLHGLYTRIKVPIVHTAWDLNMTECVYSPNNTFDPAGYMSPDRLEPDQLVTDVEEAFHGTATFGDMREPLRYGKIFDHQTLVQTSEIQLQLGWDFLQDTWYHFGVFAQASLATSNHPKAEYLFEPLSGNNGHWELGGGISGHVDCFRSNDDCHLLSFYSDIHLTHLFSSHQKRSFDLINGRGSRYMLLEVIDGPANNLFWGTGMQAVAAANQYQCRLLPAINATTFSVEISIPVQLDAVMKLAYFHGPWSWDLGYDLWYRSGERLECRGHLPANYYAIKGDAQLYGFENGGAGNPVALNATQHAATIHAGQGSGNANFQNLNADNPIDASSSAGALSQLTVADSAALGIPLVTVKTSDPAIILTDDDINVSSGLQPRAISHTFFTHINYTLTMDNLNAFIGVGASFEWVKPQTQENSGHAQWGVWAKGGLSY